MYRASKDGFSVASFHKKCDGQSNTLTIIKSTTRYIFGGYTTKPWIKEKHGFFDNDPEAFIFSLTNNHNIPMKFKCIIPQNAIINDTRNGPVFGQSELCIHTDSNKNKFSICDLGSDYNNQILNLVKNSELAKTFLAGSNKFQTTEIEVFRLED